MKTRRWRRWIFMAVLLVGVLCLRQPVQAAESQMLGDTMRLAVKVATALIHSEASGDSAVVKNVGFGEQLKVTEKTGNWYKVSDGYIHTSKVVLYDKNKKHIALTFDDGPDARYTSVLLDGLRARNIKVSFFLLGEKVEQNPDLVRRMQEEGHLVGNHTYHHVQLDKLSDAKAREEILKTNNLIYETTGRYPQYMRPPFGAWKKNLELRVEMMPVFWTIDTLDWKVQNTEQIIKTVEEKIKDGSIILMHDEYKTTVEAALRLADSLKEKGYELVTVDELIMP